jgi:hypothetical protein
VEHGDSALVARVDDGFHVEQLPVPVPFHVKLTPARLAPVALIHVKRPS